MINLKKKKFCCEEKIERIESNFRANQALLICPKCAQDCNGIKSDFPYCKINSTAVN